MSEPVYEQLTLFQEASPASLSVWPESKPAKKTKGISGPKCAGLSENLSRIGCLVRMYLESCELPGIQFARTWSVKATALGYSIMKLRLSERRIDVNGCSLWHTPDTADATDRLMRVNSRGEPMLSGQVKLLPTPTATIANHGGPNQRDSSGRPGLQMAVALMPTPTVNGNNNRKGLSAKSGDGLATVVKMFSTPQAGDYRSPNMNPGTKGISQQLPQSGHALPASRRSTQSGLGGMADELPAWVDGIITFPQEPDIPHVAIGVKNRVDRLKCLGNAVVPQQIYPILAAIAAVERT